MKVKKLLITASLLLSITVFGQEKKHAIKTNIFGLISGQYQLVYEHLVTEKVSIQLSAGYVRRSWETSINFGSSPTQKDYDSQGYIIIPEVRFYLQEEKIMNGLYISSFGRFKRTEIDVIKSNSNTTTISTYSRNVAGGGILLGYQFLINNFSVIDLFLGPQVKSVREDQISSNDPNNTGEEFEGESEGIGLRIGLNIGIAF